MINHVRTLLLNEPSSAKMDYGFPLEEYVPNGYVPVVLPNSLRVVYQALFNTYPDRAYKNWRLYQISTLAESSELYAYWHKLDQRVSHFNKTNYDRSAGYGTLSVRRDSLFTNYKEVNGVLVIDKANTSEGYTTSEYEMGIFFKRSATADESKGKCLFPYKLSLNGTRILSDPDDKHYSIDYVFELDGGRSTFTGNVRNIGSRSTSPPAVTPALPVPGTNVYAYIYSISPGDNVASYSRVYTVDIVGKPTTDLGAVMANLDTLTTVDMDYLFRGTGDFETFKSYWLNSDSMPDRINAVALALAFRMDEIRSRS